MGTLAKKVAERFTARTSALEDEDFEERLGLVADITQEARDLLEGLQADPDDILGTAVEIAEELVDNLMTAETVEKAHDLDANLKDAVASATKLGEELKRAKDKAKREKLPESLEIIRDSEHPLRSVVHEVKEILADE